MNGGSIITLQNVRENLIFYSKLYIFEFIRYLFIYFFAKVENDHGINVVVAVVARFCKFTAGEAGSLPVR